ncbi:MAG: hypothetical protein CMH32_04080 [Micavibrio sp.]|nr:hypothetical protein [Micavibrio sp.]HCK32755.1 hypothetical protein [Rhodospirillaceae bacterium]|tara:strand:- start:837 stop:2180 length:1344 start_codon:yes stop_codon:yes gene_type:complete
MTDQKKKPEIKGRAIVTYGRSLISLLIAQSLGMRGIDVIGCDSVPMTVLSFSKYVSKNHVCESYDKDEEQYVEDLIKIAKQHAPDEAIPYILIPAFDDARVLARHRDKFKGLITIAAPEYESIDKVDPKDHFAKTAEEFDVESPKTWILNDQSLDEIKKKVEFPAFIKPSNDVGGRGISKIKNVTALEKEYKALKEKYKNRGQAILLQEAADGVDYCFCGLFDKGEMVASMVYHNTRTFPKESGPGVVRETVKSERFDKIAGDLMKPLNWHGVVEIDFMWNGDTHEKPQIIEVNPRFWAGLDHSMRSDVDFPYMLYELFGYGTVSEESKSKPKIGHKTALPALSTMACFEDLFSDLVRFEALEDQWPEIKKNLKEHHFKGALKAFKNALDDLFHLDDAVDEFKQIMKEAKEVEKISYGDDDPFVGLGVLFILGSLVKYGKLPPELTR